MNNDLSPGFPLPIDAALGIPAGGAPADRPRFLSETDCHDIAQRLAHAAEGGGSTIASIWSSWTGNVRWARNQISTSGEVQNNYIRIQRDLHGATHPLVLINQTTDSALVAASRRAERLARFAPETPEGDYEFTRMTLEPGMTHPAQLFSDATYQLDAEHRADAAIALAQSAAAAAMLSAGYIEVSAHSQAAIDSEGRALYVAYTQASYSVTVRDPAGMGSGWAGVDWPDWSKIDGKQLSQLALDKCLTSRHPVAVEPGRYTTILEPQAVSDFVGQMFHGVFNNAFDRGCNETTASCSDTFPFIKQRRTDISPGYSQLGEQIVDERITIRTDPLDPMLQFPPFYLPIHQGELVWAGGVDIYHPVTWIDRGMLNALSYNRSNYAFDILARNTGLPNEGALHMSGGQTSVDEMIVTTKRGLLVTRLDSIVGIDKRSLLMRGYTRDGLWLIENGKISKAVKNMVFTESILFVLNNVEQLGVPQRTFHPAIVPFIIPQPVVVPPLKIRDFSFTALTDAI